MVYLQCEPLPIVHPCPLIIISKICSRLSWKQYLFNNLLNNQNWLLNRLLNSHYTSISPRSFRKTFCFKSQPVSSFLIVNRSPTPFPMRKLRTCAITLVLTFQFISQKNVMCLAGYINDWMLESHGKHQTVSHIHTHTCYFSKILLSKANCLSAN